MSPLKQAYTVGDMKTFEGERSLIEERSSSDAFRFTSNLESTLAEEGVPRLKYLDDLYGDKPPGSSATNDTEQLTLRELEHIHKREEEVSDSNVAACESAEMRRNEDPQEVEGEETPDGTGGLSATLSCNLVNCDSTKNAEMALPSQGEEDGMLNRPQSPEEPSQEAENVKVVQSDGTDEVLKSCAKQIAKARLHRHRRALERKIPMRSSLRPRKRVLATKLLMEDEEKKEPSKKHFCLYCKMAFSQLEKHLEKRHAEETDVAHAIHFPKGSKVRQSLLDQIRNKGDYARKSEVVRGGVGEIAAKQPKNANVSVRDSLPCQHCFASYRNTDLWRHEQSCKVRKGFERSSETTGKSGATGAAARVPPDPEFLTEGCREIIDIMNQDDVSQQIRNDPLICKYGNSLSVKYDCDKSQFAHIAQRMRELGRFVLAVNELDNNVKYLHEICVPSRFELAVEGAKKMGAVDQASGQFKTVSLVSKIGYALKRAAEIAFGDSRMMEDSETENKLKRFLHLLDTKWSTSFSRKAPASSVKREIKKADLDKSTVTEDLIKLHRFISGEEEEARRELKEGPSLSTWKKLSEATLADICLFNRGRVGNIGRMLLHTYTHKKQKGAFVPSADQVKKNTKLELHLGAQFTRLELEGQFGRNTLVLLTERMVSSVDLLIEHREQAGVSKTNPYLFARTEGPSFIRGLDCFRRAAMECGVKNPEALLSSCLREQIACCWQLMSLSEHESQQVASLLGISGEDCCRLSEHTSQLEEISQQLLKLDRTLSASPPTTVRDGAAQKSALKRRPWAEKEQAAVKRYLCEFITTMKVPGKKECNACIAAEPDLSGRSWTDVKNYVHNTLQTMRRRNNLQYAEGNLNRSPRNRIRTPKKALEDTHLCNMTTVHPDHLRESADCLMPMAPAMDLSESAENFSQDMNPTYASLCSTSTNIVHDTQPLISSFTALNATDTQVVPTFTPRNTTNALMSEAYSSESSIIMSMSPYAHSAMPPPLYAAQDPLSSPMIPSFSTFSAPSTSVMPTFTTLNSPSSPLLPSFSTVHRNPPMVSSFTPLNHPDASVYDDNPPRVPTTAQVVPTAHGPGASERTLHVLGSAAPSDAAAATEKPQKRIKRLWSEEEQAAVRRQFGDFCKLVKVPGKRDCDACLAAEPALNSRTWREVKYFVHNSIQSMRKKGQPVHTKPCEGPEPETHHPSVEWDGPVYLSL
ncbi:M-phase phosphoprotein 8 isoform X3 [Takifugu flavidus]|nr:M-phase phosphoprotein 8 isoform X3 [Takifugu flavidus]